jgi:predicted O-methyltransferase YrrM
MPKFSSDWFSHNVPSWKQISAEVRWDPTSPKTAVEIGSYEGRSTCWIVSNLLRHPDSKLYCVDMFEAPIERRQQDVSGLFERFASNVREPPDHHKIAALKGKSIELFERLRIEKVRADFIYIDGSHFAADVLQDLATFFLVAKIGGLIICDDYLWSMEPAGAEDVLNSPKIAIDAFTTIFRRKISIVRKQALYQLAFVKTSD